MRGPEGHSGRGADMPIRLHRQATTSQKVRGAGLSGPARRPAGGGPRIPEPACLAPGVRDRCLRRHGVATCAACRQGRRSPGAAVSRPMNPAASPSTWSIRLEWRMKSRGSACPGIDHAPPGLHPHLQGKGRNRHVAVASGDPERACPIRVRTILTHRATGTPPVRATVVRGKEFTGRPFGLHRRAATGGHAFDRLCDGPDIDHPTPPGSPRTNGMVERFDGGARRRCKAITSDQAKGRKRRCIAPCPAPQPADPAISPGQQPPLQAMRDRNKLKPQLFGKQPCCPRGCDIDAVPAA